MKQHTALWRATKAHYIGANDCASILGHGFYTIDQVIQSKVHRCAPTVTPEQQARMDYGTKYEGLVRQACAERHGITIHETGLRFHKKFSYLTASPDGIYRDSEGKLVLTEFKVLSELSDGKIPLKYWIQIQIQMAVWGVQRCLYCENIVKNEKIKEYYEHFVDADPEWFTGAMTLISQAWSTIEQQRSANRRVKVKRKALDEDSPTAICPNDLVNYIRHDQLLDWLNVYGPEDKKDTVRPKFFTMINRLGNQFSYLVKQYFKDHVNVAYTDLDTVHPRTSSPAEFLRGQIPVTSFNVLKTRDAIQVRTPLIFNATFSSDGNQGVADILMLNGNISNMFNLPLIEPADVYSVVQIYYATLDLSVKGNALTNNAKQRAYKAKAWFLNNLLTEAQGYRSKYCYAIGRGYHSKGVKITNSFGNIAVIDNDEHEEEHKEALKWRVSMKREIPLVNMEFNMKNINDFPWHSYKVSLGKVTKDITNMYRCGPKIRENAKEANVEAWDNSGLTIVKGIHRSVGAFIEANRTPTETFTINGPPLELPRYRFYIDFETSGGLYDDFSTFPESAKDVDCIFLIGVIAEDNETGATEYFSYIAEDLTRASELSMIERMFCQLSAWMKGEQEVIPLLHWGNAEKYHLKKTGVNAPVQLIDLCDIMRKREVIFPGQFGYGLKEMGRVMKGLQLISTGWPEEDSDISNGMDAMVEAIRVYKYKAGKDDDFWRQVVKYNYIDCKVMQEIRAYLRL
jgi:hypothetical protein